tara:strand:- start:186 stop:734 length:549 start_codon:yes stop_codon:yes gene_type:complete
MPLAWLFWLIVSQGTGPNSAEFINRYLGAWALKILWISLSITPVRLITRINVLTKVRRLVGLFSFFYVTLHLASYIALDQFFDWSAIWNDITKRTFITFGVIGFLILSALAMTSTRAMIKKIGSRNWNRLHKGVYIAAGLVAIHFTMMRKGFQIEPLIYAGILASLLAVRAFYWIKEHGRGT